MDAIRNNISRNLDKLIAIDRTKIANRDSIKEDILDKIDDQLIELGMQCDRFFDLSPLYEAIYFTIDCESLDIITTEDGKRELTKIANKLIDLFNRYMWSI